MKKWIAGAPVLLTMLALAACGGKGEPPAQDGGSSALQDGETAQTQAPQVDFGAIMAGGGTDIIYGQLDPASKQALIADAKQDGYDVCFGADGSMSVTDGQGNTAVQKPDGTWNYNDADGTLGQIGGNWPDNEFTRLVPKPDFPLSAASTDAVSFDASFADASIEQLRSYVEKVKAAGFTEGAQTEDQDTMGMAIYNYSASNSGGYTIEVFSAAGISGMTISK